MPEPTPEIAWAKTAFSDERFTRYAQYDRYLAGDQPLSFATPKFDSAFGKTFEAFDYNRCSMVIDAMLDRMQIAGFAADDTGIHTDAQQIWDDNQMDVIEEQVYREQFAKGDAYVYVEVDPDDGRIVIWPQDPHNIRVRYDPDRPGRIAVAAKHWTDPVLKRARLNLYYPDRIEKYAGRTQATSGDTQQRKIAPGNIALYEPYEVEGEPWPLPLAITDTVPIFHFANQAPINGYGVSELADVLPVQDALNKSLMDLLVAMEFAAFPQRWMVNVDMEDSATAEAVQKFQAGIDRILELYGENVSLGEFSAANIAQYTDVVELFDTLISRVSKVPVHYLKMSGDFPSGEALRIAETPFIKKMETRHKRTGFVWSEVLRYGVRLKRRDAGEAIKRGAIRANWEDAAPMSETEEAQLIRDLQGAGFAFETALKHRGYEPDQIAEAVEKRREERDEAARQFNRGLVPALDGSLN